MVMIFKFEILIEYYPGSTDTYCEFIMPLSFCEGYSNHVGYNIDKVIFSSGNELILIRKDMILYHILFFSIF